MLKLSRLSAVAALSLTVPMVAQADEASVTLEALAAQLKAQQAQIEALTAEVEKKESAAGGAEWFKNTTLGGYGEMHFSHLKDAKGVDAGFPNGGDSKGDSLDFHRFVLFVGHQFNDKVRFFSELELEHSLAGEGKPGEVELEQAYIDWQYAEKHNVVTGQFLLPIGYFNETHEPETFYGVERPKVEGDILAGVWWEGGVMGQGEIVPGVKYDVAVTSGLNTATGAIRAGRQKVAKANADDHAYTVRLRYTGIAGLDTGVTYQRQQDLTQQDTMTGASDKFGQADLLVGHVALNKGGFGLRAVYAQWEIEGFGEGSAAQQSAANQWGWYVEPSYKVLPNLGLFVRYSELDAKDGDHNADRSATNTEGESRVEQVVAGVNYWLTPRVVFKADVQNENLADGTDKEGFNLGVGFSF